MASVAGEVFDDLILDRINFFPQINTKILNQRLVELSKAGIIECLGPQLKFRVYRFVDPIIRNIVYEKMLFQQRRTIHNQFKEYFKINPTPEYMFFGMDKTTTKIMSENVLYYHFTMCAPPKEESKGETESSRNRQLYIDVVKALVVHAVKLAESNNAGEDCPIMAQTFKKISKDIEKLPVSRYYVVTKNTFSYYESEDHFNYSSELSIMKFYHSDISEVSLYVEFANKESKRYQRCTVSSDCLFESMCKERSCNQATDAQARVYFVQYTLLTLEKSLKLKFALEYLKLIHLHSTLSREFGSITLPHSLTNLPYDLNKTNDQSQGCDLAERIHTLLENSQGGKEDHKDEEQTMSELKESEERRKKISELMLDELKAFYKKLLLSKH